MAIASSLRFRLLARIGGRAAAASLIVTLCSVMFVAGPAHAACDVLDPTCVVETIEDTVDSATETVDETTGDAGETIDETVEEAIGTVEETVESVAGEADRTVDEIVGSGSGPVDDAIGGTVPPTLPGTDPVPPRTVDPPQSTDGGAGDGSDGDGTRPDRPIATRRGGVGGTFVLDPSPLGVAPAIENTPAPGGFLGGLAGPAGEIARRIAFPLALALLVFLFVAFQDRLDRRDPKLALATTSPDVLRFA